MMRSPLRMRVQVNKYKLALVVIVSKNINYRKFQNYGFPYLGLLCVWAALQLHAAL